MRLSFQIALAVLVGFGHLYVGGLNFYSPAAVFEQFYNIDLSAYDQALRMAVEVQLRLLSGMWIASGIAVLLSLRNFEGHDRVLYLALIGLSLGSIGELLAVHTLGGEVSDVMIKSGGQITICLAMVCWRLYLEKHTKSS